MTIVEERSRDLGRAIASNLLEGVTPTAEFLHVAAAYASGAIDLQAMLEWGESRWPLVRD